MKFMSVLLVAPYVVFAQASFLHDNPKIHRVYDIDSLKSGEIAQALFSAADSSNRLDHPPHFYDTQVLTCWPFWIKTGNWLMIVSRVYEPKGEDSLRFSYSRIEWRKLDPYGSSWRDDKRNEEEVDSLINRICKITGDCWNCKIK
jgi:hypothetical protein